MLCDHRLCLHKLPWLIRSLLNNAVCSQTVSARLTMADRVLNEQCCMITDFACTTHHGWSGPPPPPWCWDWCLVSKAASPPSASLAVTEPSELTKVCGPLINCITQKTKPVTSGSGTGWGESLDVKSGAGKMKMTRLRIVLFLMWDSVELMLNNGRCWKPFK